MNPAADHPNPPTAPRFLPWWLGTLMLGVYGLTLNHWVSPASLGLVARGQGLTWIPSLNGPVTFLLTRPFGWLPAAWVPPAMNLFAALCAALSLAWLARSVMLLPHATAKDGRTWQMSFKPPQLLVSRAAWLPPLLAVLVAGLQLSFWQNAIAATGEMVNLLLFAYVIRSLLEYNACGRDAWLLRGAFAYGLAMANDWSLAVFLLPLLLALVWVKRLFIFQEAFLKQLFRHPRAFKLNLLWQIPGCWLAGLSLLLLLPVLAGASAAAPVDFWAVLKHTCLLYKTLLFHYPRPLLLITGLIFILPFFLAGRRVGPVPASQNRLDFLIGPVFFEGVRSFFLLACLWMMFDSPLSPRHLAPDLASLPLYFLGALNIGWLAGHFLLISEPQPEPEPQRQRRSTPMERREKQLRRIARHGQRWVLPVLSLLTVGIPAALAGKNLPLIARQRADACGAYITQVEQALPPGGAVIVDTDPFRLTCLQSALIRSHRTADCLLLNVTAFTQPGYLDFLKRNNPEFSPAIQAASLNGGGGDAMVLRLLQELSKTHPLCCLPPAPLAGELGEFFDAQPAGLLEELKPCAANSEFAGPPPPEVLRDNETFWAAFATQQLPDLIRRINPPASGRGAGLAQRFLNTLRFRPEPDMASRLAGTYYAVALNDWGVDLQKARQFADATPCFAGALQLNSLNAAAQINHQFNTNYLANGTETMQAPGETAGRMNEFGGWLSVLRDGMVDEPNFCFMLGAFAAENQLQRPALAQFDRARQLAPARPDAYTSLARLFIQREDYVNALTAINHVLALSPTNQEGLVLLAGIHMRTQAWLAAIPCLTRLLELDPANTLARLNRARAYRNTGQLAAARQDDNEAIQSAANATNVFSAYFDLAEMADQAANRPLAITNYELFLKYAPTNIMEIAEVKMRLKALQPASP